MKKSSGNFQFLWLAVSIEGIVMLPATGFLLVSEGLPRASLPPLLVSIAAHAVYFRALAAAYEAGDISVAYPIARGLGVAGTGLAGLFVIQERISRIGGAGIAAVFAGVLLVGASGAVFRGQRRAWLLAAATGATIILYSVADKFGAAAGANPLLYLGLLNLGSSALTLPLALRKGAAGLRETWAGFRISIVFVALAMGGTYLLILWVFRLERASYIVAVRESSIIFAVLLGRFLLKEKIDGKKAAGTAAIIAGLAALRLG